MNFLALITCLLAADVTIRIDAPSGTTVTLTIVVPETNSVQVVRSLAKAKAMPLVIPAPPMPVMMTRQYSISNRISLAHIRALPGATNRSYAEHLDQRRDWAEGRRSQ